MTDILPLPPDAQTLVLVILATLGLGSAVAWVLKRAVARGRPHGVIDNIGQRMGAWWIMAALLGSAFLLGRPGVVLLFAGVAILALHEFLTAGGPAGGRTLVGLGIASGVGFAPALLWLDLPGHPDRGGYLLMFLLMVSQLGDVFQYIWGKLFGRHPLAPRISPAKTLEGLAGGLASAAALGAALAWMTPFTPLQGAGMALGIVSLGVTGGLLLSAEKRRRGIKDWGTRLPGHGGMLDRVDSVFLSAPGFYGALWLGWG
ncbi:MAG: phosphatidate cytidylyltransferase [Pseudomonadota bacterium]